ncbi:MAG: hypothetical protein QNJ14_11665 [Woeseiaceae bacterium]|nr:hypothetical protein [Woeseiaceae bacterium]
MSRLGKHAAVIASLAFLMPSQARAQSDDSLARFCGAAAAVWHATDQKYVPKYIENHPGQRDMESYWRHSFQGVSVPVPMRSDGWHLFFGDSNYVKGLAGLSNLSLQVSFGFAPSLESLAVKGIGDIATELGLPASDLKPIELVRLAVSIDLEEVVCDPNDVQSTINNLSAVFVKATALSMHDRAYLHQDGVLGHSTHKTADSWTYVFEGETPGSLFRITIRNEDQGRYPYIGFEIAEKSLSESVYSPPWMPVFFEAATEPSKDRLVGLQKIVSDHSFPDETFEELAEKLAEFD